MADLSPNIPLGESSDSSRATVGTDSYTIKGEYRAMLVGHVTAGAARVTVSPNALGDTKFCDVDFAAGVDDMVINSVHLRPGDVVKLTLDTGAAGFVLLRLLNAKEG